MAPRSLVRANVERAINGVNESDLKPGYIRLYPLYRPRLPPGNYGIEVKQSIKTSIPGDEGKLEIFNYDSTTGVSFPPPATTPVLLQKFDVVAPQFSLDPDTINSHYPPDGGADEGLILPHIVFNDPHIPWDRIGPSASSFAIADRGIRGPWFALLVFDPEDLKVSPAEVTSLGISPASAAAATSSGAFPMTAGDYLTKITSRPTFEAAFDQPENNPAWKSLTESTENTTVIFPKRSQAAAILKDPYKFFFMCHVREMNTMGFPDAGTQQNGLFSICVSHMTGPRNNTVPRTQVVHLINIEQMDKTQITGDGRIGLCSLYSWTYLSLPPNPINFKDIMTNLAATKQMLRIGDESLGLLQGTIGEDPNSAVSSKLLHERLSLGYTIHRWRAATGEETLAFSRGPLTPAPTSWKPSVADDWPGSSNTGKEYQVLDKDLGVMDLTYSSAWQLGKLMAVSDTVFNSALLRFRSLVHRWASSETRIVINGVLSPQRVLREIPTRFKEVRDTTNGHDLPARNLLPTSEKVGPSLIHPKVLPVFERSITRVFRALTASGDELYSDYTLGSANNSDWEIIHNWISDKLFLADIPAHYLIPDPSYLPSEALRFFYIDDCWLDCFIDGALSTANHFEPVDDRVRRRIKEAYNVYLRTEIPSAGMKPPVPRYGFILRSELIRVMPDIRIVARRRRQAPNGAPVLIPDNNHDPLIRLTKLDERTVFALLDCLPEDLFEIKFIQPPHQQRYIASFELRRLYTKGAPVPADSSGSWPPIPAAQMPTPDKIATWYDANTRCIDVPKMIVDLRPALLFQTPTQEFLAQGLDSTVLALELNDSSYQLQIFPPRDTGPVYFLKPDRQLWAGKDMEDLAPRPLRVSEQDNERLTRSGPNQTIPTLHAEARVHQLRHRSARSSRPVTVPQTRREVTAQALIPGGSSQYRIVIHPDYRGAPPFPDLTDAVNPVYSAQDYIPTATKFLPSLIFSIKRNTAAPPINLALSSITVVIPADIEGDSTLEPLLKGVYAGAGADMLSNRRLVTSVSHAHDEVRVVITPRTTALGKISSLPDTVTGDCSLVLKECVIAPVGTPVSVNIFGLGGQQRGMCKVRVIETYLQADGTTGEVFSDVVVLKREGGDKDLKGVEV
ncbi:hypothetical protein M501DRAFT_992402 [Patellaria atrata CBS 101060]|uniref:Uncharacterized protein n=1 Tax=Patellaria atrata CBS 101060 TaxID=1346257 RepID=A0A9P4VN80_9PEZI|nr:hypothetical protein M501DRAFT_992402 [Patellaria atrata CBS 101060]